MAGFISVMAAIGTAYVVCNALCFFRAVLTYLRPTNVQRFLHSSKDGRPAWALVTGASDGIGKNFAAQLADAGFNVVLHGRNPAKLDGVASTLRDEYPHRQFKTLVADASKIACVGCIHDRSKLHADDASLASSSTVSSSSSAYDKLDFEALAAQLKDLHLTVLVNNAGGGPVDPMFASLVDSPELRITNTVAVNGLFPIHLTRVLLPQLAANGPSLVLNVSSLSDSGFPLIAPYSSSKAFLLAWAKAARLELALDGQSDKVEMLTVRVGKVTDVSLIRQAPSLFVPPSHVIAKSCLSRVGKGSGNVIAHWSHAIQQVGLVVLPSWCQDMLILGAIRSERDMALKAV